jgi:hypothetical protein
MWGRDLETAKKILARQRPYRTFSAYEPSQRVSRDEAPAISQPSLQHDFITGRAIHLMSNAEQGAFALAQFYGFVDIREQAMAPPFEDDHVLSAYEAMRGVPLPHYRGTVAVAEELQIPHPKAVDKSKQTVGDYFPLLGDIELILPMANSRLRCVDWWVKPLPTTDRRDLELLAIRRQCNADVGIPTVEVYTKEVPKTLLLNINLLRPFVGMNVSVDNDTVDGILDFTLRHGYDVPFNRLMPDIVLRFSVDYRVAKMVVSRGIWQEKLPVDLFKPFSFGHELLPATTSAREWIAERFIPSAP